jgi:hypothetical protein
MTRASPLDAHTHHIQVGHQADEARNIQHVVGTNLTVVAPGDTRARIRSAPVRDPARKPTRLSAARIRLQRPWRPGL